MSFETNASGRRPKWASRRILGSVLGLAVVVGTAATAQATVHASAHGDGFYAPPRSATASYNSNQYRDNDGHNYSSSSSSSSSNWNQGWTAGHRNWNDQWTWNGTGWNKYEFRTIGNSADPTFNQLLGINDRGTIVGYYGSGEDAQHPNQGYWTDSPYGQGNFRDENYPGSVQTQVIGITKHGDTAGFYVDDKGDNHGFVRWNGEWSEVNYPGSHFNQLLGINSAGIAVGFFNDAKGNAHGYTYNARTHAFVLIILPGRATAITVTGINDRNQVVGFATIGKVTVGFIWTSRHAIVIIRLGNGTNTQILGINNAGVVVGSFVDGHKRTHGFMKDNWRTRTIDAPHSASTVINGLNNKGQIVGFYTDNEEHTLGFLAHS